MIKSNISNTERVLRILGGVILLALIPFTTGYSIAFWSLLVFGILFLITGLISWCGLYHCVGACKTKEEKKSNKKAQDDIKQQIKSSPKTSRARKTTTTKKVDKKEEKTQENEELSEEEYPKRTLTQVVGMTQKDQEKVKKAGFKNTQTLQKQISTKKGRQELSKKINTVENKILTWANHIDLYRVKGVSFKYANLLHEAGVDTIPELAQRNAQNLAQKMQEVNEKKNYVKTKPSSAKAQDWIDQAKKLSKVVSH